MIDFNCFKAEEGKPIYLQILYYIKRGAAAGTISDGEPLPSRRVLSALLGINPNTVQKAFKALEDEHLIESRMGAGSVMVLDPERIEALRVELLTEDIRSLTVSLVRTGVTKQEALELIDRYWDDALTEQASDDDASKDTDAKAEASGRDLTKRAGDTEEGTDEKA